MTSFFYPQARLLMLRARRRACFVKLMVGAGCASAVASIAFLTGFLHG